MSKNSKVSPEVKKLAEDLFYSLSIEETFSLMLEGINPEDYCLEKAVAAAEETKHVEEQAELTDKIRVAFLQFKLQYDRTCPLPRFFDA